MKDGVPRRMLEELHCILATKVIAVKARTHIEEVQLIWVCCANACCEQQKIALQPLDFVRREFEAHTGTCFIAHDDDRSGLKLYR
jgi:hypothetical protein